MPALPCAPRPSRLHPVLHPSAGVNPQLELRVSHISNLAAPKRLLLFGERSLYENHVT